MTIITNKSWLEVLAERNNLTGWTTAPCPLPDYPHACGLRNPADGKVYSWSEVYAMLERGEIGKEA